MQRSFQGEEREEAKRKVPWLCVYLSSLARRTARCAAQRNELAPAHLLREWPTATERPMQGDQYHALSASTVLLLCTVVLLTFG